MRHDRRGFTIAETLLSMFLIGVVMLALGMLFQRSFDVLRKMDDKERVRQVSRMGLDRMTSELREATKLGSTGPGILSFEKIDPGAVMVNPTPAPVNPTDSFTPAPWGPAQAYPDTARLEVKFEVANDSLVRSVRRKGGGAWTSQVVVSGVNAFTSSDKADNTGEVTVVVTVIDGHRAITLSGTVLCPCLKEPYS